MFIERESYLNEYHRRQQLARLENHQMINGAGLPRRPHILAQLANFWHTLNHLRQVKIEVKFEYQEPHPEATGFF